MVGEVVTVRAKVFQDGHDLIGARVRWRREGKRTWHVAPLTDLATGTDDWSGTFSPSVVGSHEFVVEAWKDRFATWRHDVEIKAAVGDDIELELEEGARILESLAPALGSRSRRRVLDAAEGLRRTTCALQTRLNAGLDDRVAELVAARARRGHHRQRPVPAVGRPAPGRVRRLVRVLPPQRGRPGRGGQAPPGRRRDGLRHRLPAADPPDRHEPPQGAEQHADSGPDDPGSPWAIGSPEGGHTAIHPELGTLDDFRHFVNEAGDLGLEVALDYALQCSPDHPWVREHPEWFWQRPDGSIKYAENPPKKYQDIYPINFWPARDADRQALWKACRDVLRYWVDQGVRVFRVDNPHTKPMAFWAWVIERIHRDHPDVVFLAEAFTRPDVMAKLAEVGFTQSYSYFTWRTEPAELQAYVEELAYGPTADYMRPNFWPNTPDILSGPLRHGPPAAFLMRFVLAATLAPSYGMYSGYELFENAPASDTNEEYLHSEKYEVRTRDWAGPTRWPRSSPRSTPSAAGTRRSAGCATCASTARATTTGSSSSPRATATTATWCWWWSTPTPTTRRRPCCSSTWGPSASRGWGRTRPPTS